MTEPGQGESTRSSIDLETLRKVVSRDPGALNIFFDHYFDRVYTHVIYLTGDPVLSEDLVQEAFIRLHRAIDRLDPDKDPAGWVFTVVTNTVKDHWRSKHHRRASQEVEIDALDDGTLRNGNPMPDQEAERKQTAAAVRRALASLSDNDREVLLLRTFEDLETAEVAKILEITPEAVRQRHSRAVSRLAKALKDQATGGTIGE